MQPSVTNEPASMATSAVVLWMITIYGVLFTTSVFVSCLHARQRGAFGARLLKKLALADVIAALVAPLICTLLGATGVGIAVGGAWFVMASGCLALSRLPLREPQERVPRARVIVKAPQR